MSYSWFNREKILQKAKDRYSKEKTAEYYSQNKEVRKEKVKKVTKTCQKKKNNKI